MEGIVTIENHRLRRATQADVARAAGVSQAAVSIALSGEAKGAVSQETVDRIRTLAEKMGYRVHGVAQSLRRKRTNLIAAVVPDISNPFYSGLIRGVQEVAGKRGFNVLIYNTDGGQQAELECLDVIRSLRVEGIVVVPYHLSQDDLLQLNSEGIKVAVIGEIENHSPDFPVDSVFVDNERAAESLIQHLVDQGNRKLVLLTGPSDSNVGMRRRDAFLVAIEKFKSQIEDFRVLEDEFSENGGYRALKSALPLGGFTAVVASNDLMAFGALRALSEEGLAVPADVSLTGFDDVPAASLVSPGLTTVSQGEQLLGQRAAMSLISRLNDLEPNQSNVVSLDYELKIRESSLFSRLS